MNIQELYQLFLQNSSVETDTRKIKKGDLFFALKGPNFNGNEFALQALEMGASFSVVDEVLSIEDNRIIKVDDVLSTLQELAKYHREQFSVPFIAITGSNGKTTSKELIYAVLSAHYTTYTTQGNLNNHIGVPLTLLSVKKDAEMVVIEMGANHQKEIESYCKYTLPTHGVITNCGKAHLEGFGGEAGVRKGKGELFDFIKTHQGTVFIYADYEYLQEMSNGIEKVFKYGKSEGEIQGTIFSNDPFIEVAITKGLEKETVIQTHLVGDYNLPNILCAVAIGKFFFVPELKIKEALENYIPSNSRSQLVKKGTNTLILDAYNANPSSMKAAIENFANMQATHKVLMLGGMMELGNESMEEHKNLLDLIKKYPWENVVLVGGDFSKIKHEFLFFENSTDAATWFLQQSFQNTHFLIKGSRSMQMERIVELGD